MHMCSVPAHVDEFVWLLQAVATFDSALKRLTDAGVELVRFDMGLLSAEGAEVEAELLLAYEAPREIARYTLGLEEHNSVHRTSRTSLSIECTHWLSMVVKTTDAT